MQTILGSGGAIGKELAGALRQYSKDIRLVSRNPAKVNPEDTLWPADLLDREELRKAVEASEVVYLTIGFEYRLSVWQRNWPRLMSHLIEACIDYGAKLVFFDNIYMYDPEFLDGMNENTPLRPVSKKGEIRKAIYEMIVEQTEKGKLTALIARSADFYGPSIEKTSVLTELMIKPLSRGKRANILGRPDLPHSYTYTPDAARAMALLGNNADAWQEVWHLPTAAPPLTALEMLQLIADELGTEARYRTVSKGMLKMMGLFVPAMKEVIEMLYQYEKPYFFDSSKIEKKYGLKPTSYKEGIREVIEKDFL